MHVSWCTPFLAPLQQHANSNGPRTSSSAQGGIFTDDEGDEGLFSSAQKSRCLEFPQPEDDRKPAAKPDCDGKHKRKRVDYSDDESDDDCESENDSAKYDRVLVGRYSDKIRKDHEDAVSLNGGGRANFGTLCQRDLNETQQGALDSAKTVCSGAVDIIHARDGAIDPSSACYPLVNPNNKVTNMNDNGNAPIVYMQGQPTKSAEGARKGTKGAKKKGVKVGHSTSATGRVSNYVKDLRKRVKQKIDDRKSASISDNNDDDDLELVVLINIDSLLTESQKEVVAYLLDKLSSLAFDEFPKTLGEAIGHDMNGLPFSVQALIYSLLKEEHECNMMGGGIDVNGLLIRLVLNALETGMTEWLRAKGVEIDDSACLHELFHNNCLGMFLELLAEVCKDLMSMFAKLQKEYPEDAAKVTELAIEVAKAMLSWPVDLNNKAEGFLHCKLAVANLIFGRNNWEGKCPRLRVSLCLHTVLTPLLHSRKRFRRFRETPAEEDEEGRRGWRGRRGRRLRSF